MPVVEMLHIGLGGTEFNGVRPAPLLPNPDDSAALGQRFRKLLIANALHFLEEVEILRFPLIRLQWISLCRTAGLVLLRSGTPTPDVYCLLLNGLEDADEVDTVKRHAPMFHAQWQIISEASRPLGITGYTTPSRMADGAVVTTLGAFANAYFTQFGESGKATGNGAE